MMISENTSATPRTTAQIARSTALVMLAFGAAKLISLFQTVIIAQEVGVGTAWDTFVTANRVPELIFTLISGGALAHAFIPSFTGYLVKGDSVGAWIVASKVINTIFLATSAASLLVFVFAPVIVDSVAPGFDAAGKQQTAEIMRILLAGTLIFSVSGMCMGILQSHNHFLLPALAPIMFDIGILFGVLFLLGPLGVHGIALGAVLGAILHLGVQIPGLIYYRARWYPRLGINDPIVWRIIRLMLPRVAGLGVFSFNFLVMNRIASQLGTGSVSALDWGWRLMQIPQTLIGTAMGTVIFPTLAAFSEVGDEANKRNYMSGALRFILITSIPAAFGLIAIGQPLISLLERGAFDASASALVYTTTRAFALGLVVHSALEVVARSFYADKDTMTPLWAALGGAGINLLFSYALSDVLFVQSLSYHLVAKSFSALAWRPEIGNVSGLALANSMGVMFEVLFLLWILRRRWHGANESAIAQTVIKATAASLVMTFCIALFEAAWLALGFGGRGLLWVIIQIALQIVLAVLVFALVTIALKMDEALLLFNLLLRRRRKIRLGEV